MTAVETTESDETIPSTLDFEHATANSFASTGGTSFPSQSQSPPPDLLKPTGNGATPFSQWCHCCLPNSNSIRGVGQRDGTQNTTDPAATKSKQRHITFDDDIQHPSEPLQSKSTDRNKSRQGGLDENYSTGNEMEPIPNLDDPSTTSAFEGTTPPGQGKLRQRHPNGNIISDVWKFILHVLFLEFLREAQKGKKRIENGENSTTNNNSNI